MRKTTFPRMKRYWPTPWGSRSQPAIPMNVQMYLFSSGPWPKPARPRRFPKPNTGANRWEQPEEERKPDDRPDWNFRG